MAGPPQIRNVVVTGASGFVGNCVARRLLDEGYKVHLLLRPGANLWRLSGILDRFHTCEADVTDAETVRRVVHQIQPDAILHLATYGAYEWQNDPSTILQTNILGTHYLLEAAITTGAKLFISTGSSSEYGYRSEPMRESDRLEPNSIYAVAKAAQTHLCSLHAQNPNIAIVNFRLFSVYGPWEEPSRLMPTLIRRARASLPLTMAAPETARDFIYVDDVVDALIQFRILTQMAGQIFNLGTGMQSTLRDVVSAVQEIVGSKSNICWGAMKARKWDTAQWRADSSKARDVLGFTPRFSLRDGIAKMAAWMAQIGDDYGPA